MKFFHRKKDSTRPTDDSRACIKLSGRNYAELEECDVALKLWLSEPVERMIEEMCSFVDTSASDLIRQILFIHLYGRYDLFGLIERQNHVFNLNKRVKFSLSTLPCDINAEKIQPPPDKNIADLKVWIPGRMREDLQRLSDESGKKLSSYVRDVVVTHLFGHVPPSGVEAAT